MCGGMARLLATAMMPAISKHRRRIAIAGGLVVVIIGAASWVLYFGPEGQPQHWSVVSTGWGKCGSNVQIAANYCEVHGTFRNDGGTGADRQVQASDGSYGDVYAYTALFEPMPNETCGALLDGKTHHGKTVTVSCDVLLLDLTTFQPININTTRPVKVVIESEDYLLGIPSA